MRYALFLSLVLAAAVGACSSGDSGTSDNSGDSGSETALPMCAAKSPCSCGEATCASNEFCDIEFTPGAGQTSTCVKFVEAAVCVDAPCAENELCNRVVRNGISGVTCRPAPVLAVGDACSLPSDIDFDPCPAGSFCYADLGKPYVCTKSATTGADCETFSKFACPAGETCQSIIFPEFKCRPAKKLNASCLNSTDCEIGLYCADSICKKRKEVGSPCTGMTAGAAGGECARYLQCKGGTCQPA